MRTHCLEIQPVSRVRRDDVRDGAIPHGFTPCDVACLPGRTQWRARQSLRVTEMNAARLPSFPPSSKSFFVLRFFDHGRVDEAHAQLVRRSARGRGFAKALPASKAATRALSRTQYAPWALSGTR